VKTPYKVTRNEAEEEAFPKVCSQTLAAPLTDRQPINPFSLSFFFLFPLKFVARIEALGEIFGDSIVEEVTLMRFLRARQLDPDRAEQMLLAMLKWRQENKVNTFLEDYKPLKKEIAMYTTGGIHKVDSDGDPVFIDRLGQIDAKGVFQAFGEEELLKVSPNLASLIWPPLTSTPLPSR